MRLSGTARSVLATLWQRIEQPERARKAAAEARPDHPALLEPDRAGPIQRDSCDAVLTEQGWPGAVHSVHCRPLVELAPGDEGHIACVQSHDHRALHKLTAMGILPGNPIRLLRRSPAYVFQIGYSQFAVDQDIAEQIFVRD